MPGLGDSAERQTDLISRSALSSTERESTRRCKIVAVWGESSKL
jgi:hypothetical protein